MSFIKNEPFYRTLVDGWRRKEVPVIVSLRPSDIQGAYRIVTDTTNQTIATGNDPSELLDWVSGCLYLTFGFPSVRTEKGDVCD